VLGVEGNRIKLSRKAVLREQRQKLGLPEPTQGGDMAASSDRPERSERSERPERPERGDRPPRAPRPERAERPAPPEDRQPSSNASTIMIEGGEDFDEDEGPVEEGEEINYNRADGVPVAASGERRPGGPGGPAGAEGQRRRRRRGRRPGGGSSGGGRGPQ
jgi:polyribonucleotide nucleotidyltransferase